VTTPFLVDDIENEEGRFLHAYPDPLTHAAPWTVGAGFTGPDIGPNTTMTDAQVDAELDHRVEMICGELDAKIPWWRDLSDVRQDVVVQMAYQLGVAGLMTFTQTLACLRSGDWSGAAAHMLDSRAACQTPARWKRQARQMLLNERVWL